ncbi:NRDE-2, necessary for RNA interference-domain-containing protein [Gautieria morchelliformis]|nr:NRDE-2, necessary for RNA interference-domain-containing protein [Gautieria morchelliformis]
MSPPAFSSFPPSFASFPDLEKTEDRASPSGQRKGDESLQQHSKKSKHRDRDKHKDKRDRDGRKIRDGSTRKDGKSTRHQRDDEQAKREEDRHAGDPMNVVYGGIHGGDIPKYRRVGFGNVLGLAKGLQIVNRETSGKSLEIGVNGRRRPARYTDPHFLAILTTTRPRHLSSGSLDPKGRGKLDPDSGSQAEFIRLPSRLGRSTEPLSTYRSIHTSNDQDVNSDSDATSSAIGDVAASSSEPDTDTNIPRTAHQHSIAALEASLQKDPTCIYTWYTLIDQTLSTIPPSAKSSLARARTEIRLSILDRAIRTHGQNKASVELRVKWLNAGAEVWEGDRLEKEWERAVRELGGHTVDNDEGRGLRNRMWEEWLRWRISSAGRGSRRGAGVEGIISDARRVKENLEGEMAQVKLLWRIAIVLRDAGFSERAMAMLQAQADLTFNGVPNLDSEPLPTRLNALEEFWDAEYPRLGEPSARGWNTWVREGKPEQRLPISSQQTALDMDGDTVNDDYMRWGVDEARSDANSVMPKHADDAGDDPYATVLFSDVRPLLVEITTPEAKHAFRIAWLEFLGLHVPGFVRSLDEYSTEKADDDTWSCTHLTRQAYLQQLFPSRTKGNDTGWDAYAGTIIAHEKTYGSTFGCVKEWGFGVFGALEGVNGGEGRLWEEIDVKGIHKEPVRRIFEQLRQKITPHHDEEWDVMAIAFEAADSIKSAIKLSKALLSVSRDSLPLWGVHARLQRMRGREDEARRIYDSALSTTSDHPITSSRRGEAMLWWEWAEMEWLSGDDNGAQGIIMRAVRLHADANGPMNVLRAKRGLEERMRSRCSTMDWKERESWACLRALLDVLTGGTGAVEEGMGVLERYVSEHSLKGLPLESAWTRMVLLGWKHATLLGRQARRAVVRNRVVQVVRDLERAGRGMNTAALGIFLEGEKGESVWGRVKALVGEGAMIKGVARRIWEVWLASWERGGWDGEKERVRNSLGIGVEEGSRTRASPTLWRTYVEFEIYCGELKRAKALLFRAVSECPLVKELYLLAFGSLRSVFTARELENWAETMAERGIRMHRDLDGYATKGEYDESADESEAGEENEFDMETRDYRRLAPF